eukprot:1338669-Alexandrium_andersonii.AAC.1
MRLPALAAEGLLRGRVPPGAVGPDVSYVDDVVLLIADQASSIAQSLAVAAGVVLQVSKRYAMT